MIESTMALENPELKPSAVRAGMALWRREMTHFFRQPRRLVAALLTPMLFWFFLGSGMNNVVSFAPPAPPPVDTVALADGGIAAANGDAVLGYRAYFFPGALVMMVMFTTILSSYSVIEDRREGFLQGVLIAPVSRHAVACGKILGGATIAMIQGALFLAFWPLVVPFADWASMVVVGGAAVGVLGLIAVILTAGGFMLAWRAPSSAGFHAVLNLVLFPAWFLSGALFPVARAPDWMAVIMWVNPLTWGQAALSSVLLGVPTSPTAPLHLAVSLTVTVLLAILFLWLAGRVASGVGKDGAS